MTKLPSLEEWPPKTRMSQLSFVIGRDIHFLCGWYVVVCVSDEGGAF